MFRYIRKGMVALLSCATAWASAYAVDGTIIPEDVTGNCGEAANLTINMSCADYQPIALQFDLKLSGGLTRATDALPEITPAERIAALETAIQWMPGIEAYRIVVYSLDNKKITGASGALMTLKLNLDGAPGTYEAETFNCIVTAADLSETYFDGGTAEVTVKSVPATGIKLSASELSLMVGEEMTLKATVEGNNVTDRTVTWTSSDTSVATVDANGLVKAVGEGNATITAACGLQQAKCSVTVSPMPADEIVPVNVTGHCGETANLAVNLSFGSCQPIALQFDLKISDGLTRATDALPEITPAERIADLETAIHWMPEIEAYRIVVYSLDNKKIAGSPGPLMTLKINLDGAPGTYKVETFNCIVTATDLSENKFNGGTAEITVKSVSATGIKLSASELSLIEGEETTLEATVEGTNVTDPTVTWTSSDTAVATVDANGLVKAVSEGTATITAECGEVSATCKVTVSPFILYGDSNGNNVVDVTDVITTLAYIFGYPPSHFDPIAADANRNGTIDLDDVTETLKIILQADYSLKE